MSTIATIVAKKNDDTTNITYDSLSGSQDGQWAQWRQDTGATAGSPPAARATFRMKSLLNGPGTARKQFFEYKRPYFTWNTNLSRFEVIDTQRLNADHTAPNSIPNSEITEGVAQFLSLMHSAHVRAHMNSGYSPT